MVQPQLPVELWLYITQFIPDAVLRKDLFQVNKFFYEISMDLRYRRVELQTLSLTTSKIISRLPDPHVARRVRHLTVSPDFRYYGRIPARQATLRSRITAAFHLKFRLPEPVSRPDHEATKALIDALPQLTNVSSFTIDCHSWGPHSGPDVPRFLRTAWAAFGSNLTKLSLRGHAGSFHTIIHSRPNLPLLEELFFELVLDPHPDPIDGAEVLMTDLVPFINSFAPRLRSLTLWCWGSYNLSEFFHKLEEFPLLSTFNLQTAFARTLGADPSGLAIFLHKHCSHLHHLVLRLNTSPLGLNTLSDEPLGRWMKECFASAQFSRLQELHMYPTIYSDGMNALLSCIQQSQSTLTNLVVRDRYLELEEVEKIVNLLSPELRYLRLNVQSLTVQLFDVLSGLTGLESLSLYIGTTSLTISVDIETRRYSDWKLENIGIWHSGYPLERRLMWSIATSLPLIKSFWGSGTALEVAEGDL